MYVVDRAYDVAAEDIIKRCTLLVKRELVANFSTRKIARGTHSLKMNNLNSSFNITDAYESTDHVYFLGLGGLVILGITLLFNFRQSDIPVINKRKWYEFGTEKAVHRFNTNATNFIKEGIKKVLDRIPIC